MPERIEVARFAYSQEAEYIHKYYLPREYCRSVTRQDTAALLYHAHIPRGGEDPSDRGKAMMSDGALLFYKDIGCEKFLGSEQIKTVFMAVKEWSADNGAELTDEEINAAIALNARLARLEESILKECVKLDNELQARSAGGDEFLNDYEIFVEVVFFMDDNHPAYYEDDVYHDAEVMVRLQGTPSMPGKGVAEEIQQDDYWGVGDEMDHNRILSRIHPGHPLWGIPHCRLFHELEHYSPMPMRHVGRIGMIWSEIKVLHQNFVDCRMG